MESPRACARSPAGSASAPSAYASSRAGRLESCEPPRCTATSEEPAWRTSSCVERRTQMARVIVTSDDGEMVWNEGVKASDFEAEHFRHCLVDRLEWAVRDAESTWRLSTVQPIDIYEAPGRVRDPETTPQSADGAA